jgi:nucleotide-binding universal stress UspA family protein
MTTTLKVCVAAHGYEPQGWGLDVSRVLATFVAPAVRVLAMATLPSAPFTSLLPPARRAWDGARATHLEQETQRLERVVSTLDGLLPHRADIVTVTCEARRLATTITDEAERWGADLLIVGRPAAGFGTWLWPGPIHEQVLRRAACAVIVTPPAPRARAPKLVAMPRGAAAERRA